jgi:ribA/ribD-fused uncharacterized protein
MEIINSFKGKYSFLSNFSQFQFEYDGLTYYSSEAAFQAQKCSTIEGKIKYTLIKNPLRVKQMGRRETLPADWDVKACDIMYSILKSKFDNPVLKQKLLSTKDAYLEEGNTWHDNRWGNCSCEKCKDTVGLNQLGKLLMRIRDEIDCKEE